MLLASILPAQSNSTSKTTAIRKKTIDKQFREKLNPKKGRIPRKSNNVVVR